LGKRHRSRQLALQILYAREYLDEPPRDLFERLVETDEVSPKTWTDFCGNLVNHTLEQQPELDATISKALDNWRIERLSKVDRAILRLALCEMRSFANIPIRVTLNEYIDLAKEFGTSESSAFVNGILDRLSRDFSDKDFGPDSKPKHPPAGEDDS
jgi:N utilization substance protein B